MSVTSLINPISSILSASSKTRIFIFERLKFLLDIDISKKNIETLNYEIFRNFFFYLNHSPITSLFEIIICVSLGLSLVSLFLLLRKNFDFLFYFLLFIVNVLLFICLFLNSNLSSIPEILLSNWLFFHVFFACLAYPLGLAGSFSSFLYIIKNLNVKSFSYFIFSFFTILFIFFFFI